MTRTALLVLFAAVPAVAAPIPEAEAERLAVARVYGAWTDPVGDCTYRAAGGRLHVRLPEPPRVATEWVPGPISAPRFVREVDGDFTATVWVEVPPQPDGRLSDGLPGTLRHVAAGLTAEDAAGNRAGVRRCEKLAAGSRIVVEAAWRKGMGEGGAAGRGAAGQSGRTYVRMARTGPTVRFGFSWDGDRWTSLTEVQVGWSGPVRLGLIAESSVGVPVEVTFDRFTLTRAKN